MAVVSSVVYAGTAPFSLASGRYGHIYGVNGLTRGFRFDGVTLSPIGITAAPSVSITTSTEVLYYVSGVAIASAGENYVRDPQVQISGVSGIKVSVGGGGVLEVTITESATTHVSAPRVSFSGGQALGGTVGVTTIGSVAKVDIGASTLGLGYYTTAPEITISAATHVTVVRPAKAVGVLNYRTLTATSGTLDSVLITDQGEYIMGGGSGAGLSASVAAPFPFGLTSTNQSYAPNLTPRFSGQALSVTASGGTEYLTPPIVRTNSPRQGGGAVIAVAVDNGELATPALVSPGSGYSQPVSAYPYSPAAVAQATIQPRLNGVYLCGIRYVDDTPSSRGGPVAGSMSDLVEVDCTPGTKSITWTLPTSPSDGTPNRIAKIELWRSTADQSSTLYKVTEFAVGSIPATYEDALPDFLLVRGATARETYFVRAVQVTASGSGYSSPPTVTASGGNPQVAATFKAVLLGTSVDSVTVASPGSGYASPPTLTFSGSGSGATATAVMGRVFIPSADDPNDVLPILTADGFPSAYRYGVPPPQMSVICMFQDRAWYAVDTTGASPNAIYFSEVDEPESVPNEYQVIVQQNGREPDKITGLIPLAAALYVAQTKNLYRLTNSGNPLTGAAIDYIGQRGLVNDRCWDILEGVAYAVDYAGMYAFSGQQIEPISDPVATYWSEHLFDWDKQTWFFVRADDRERVVRFYYAPASSGSAYPTAALCYSVVTRAWWREEYAMPVSAACTLRVNGDPATVLGGATQLIQHASGFTDLGAPIPYSMKSGAARLTDDARRGIRLTYTPTSTTESLAARFYYDNASTPRSNAVASNTGHGFVTNGGTEHTLDMSLARSGLQDSNGYAQLWLSGRVSDHSVGADRHIAVQVSGTQSAAQAILHRLEIEGAG